MEYSLFAFKLHVLSAKLQVKNHSPHSYDFTITIMTVNLAIIQKKKHAAFTQ